MFSFVSSKFMTWEPNTTLNVVFLDGKPEYKAKVEQIARQWTQYANLNMTFDDPSVVPARAHVRISFERPGYWSAIGSSSRQYAADEPTMIPGTSALSLWKMRQDLDWIQGLNVSNPGNEDIRRLERLSIRMQCLLADFSGCFLL